jgi:hypothetical protein
MKQPASARKSSKSSASSKANPGAPAKATKEFVICVKHEGYEASLEVRKIYRTLEDGEAHAHRLLRVVDESGGDYLYPRANFLQVILPLTTRRAVLAAT